MLPPPGAAEGWLGGARSSRPARALLRGSGEDAGARSGSCLHPTPARRPRSPERSSVYRALRIARCPWRGLGAVSHPERSEG